MNSKSHNSTRPARKTLILWTKEQVTVIDKNLSLGCTKIAKFPLLLLQSPPFSAQGTIWMTPPTARTPDVFSNGSVLLSFGVFTNSIDNTRKFQPLCYSYAASESEVSFAVTMVAFLSYARRLFNLRDIKFKGGLCSDRSYAFVNVFQRSFPRTTSMQCFPHLIRKLKSGKSNGAWVSQFNSEFVDKVARPDLLRLHNCLTKPMFDKLSSMVESSWCTRPQGRDLWETLSKSYMREPFCNWYVGCSIPLCYPSNNPCEANNSELKGSAGTNREGLVRKGLTPSKMFSLQLPSAIYKWSIANVGVNRRFLVDNPAKLLNPTSSRHQELVGFAEAMISVTDLLERRVRKCGEDPTVKSVFYVNRLENAAAIEQEGRTITDRRIDRYEDALKGINPVPSEEPAKFYNVVASLCKVRVHIRICSETGEETEYYRASCEDFLKAGYCHHCGYLAVREKLHPFLHKIQQFKPGRCRRTQPKVAVGMSERETARENLLDVIDQLILIRSQMLYLPLDDRFSRHVPKSIKKYLNELQNLGEWKIKLKSQKKLGQKSWYQKRLRIAEVRQRRIVKSGGLR